jgi:hypothetical protein
MGVGVAGATRPLAGVGEAAAADLVVRVNDQAVR